MAFSPSFVAFAFLILDSHRYFASASPTPPTRGINWFACPQNSSIATTCGTLDVPLDYTAATSNASLTLQLVKVCRCWSSLDSPVALRFSFADASIEQINATTQPSKGSIIFDFGGPGNINVDNFAGSNGEALLL